MQNGRIGSLAGAKALAWMVLIVSVLALVAGQGGQASPALDVLTHFNGHLLGAALSAAVALLLGRYIFAVLVAGAAATIAVHTGLALAPLQPHPPIAGFATALAKRPANEAPLKVISLNSWHANRSPEKIKAYLKSERADVVVLIEFGPNKAKLLRQLRAIYPHQVHCVRQWHCALALLSRKPFVSAKATPPGRGRPALVWARFADAGSASGALTVIGTHIYRPTRSPRLHQAQMSFLATFTKRIKGPLVVAGDFNATPWSWSYKRFVRDSGLRPAGSLLPSWPAWPVNVPQFAIDHLFVSSGLNVSARGVGPTLGSDHLPIWALISRRGS